AAAVPVEQARGLSLIGRLLRRPIWLAGAAADVAGYAAEAAALAFGSILVVQPILATTLLFAIPLSAALSKARARPADVAWAALPLGGGSVDLVTSWEPYALAVCAIAGLLLQQGAYQAGGLSLSLPVIAVLEPITATAIGVGVFEETVTASGAGWVLVGASVV